MDPALQEIVKEQNAAAAESAEGKTEVVGQQVTEGSTEQKTQEGQAQPHEQKPETTVHEGTQQTTSQSTEVIQTEEKDTFIDTINKEFNRSFNNRDEITSIFDSINKYDEFQSNIKNFEAEKQAFENQKQEIEKEREEMMKFSRPEHIFGSQENYRNYLIARKYEAEDKDVDAVKAMISDDVSSLNSLEKVALVNMFNNKMDYNDAAAAALISVGADIENQMSDDELSTIYKELPYQQKIKLEQQASEAMKTIKEVRGTEVDDKDYWKNFEERQEQYKKEKQEREGSLKEAWKPEVDVIRKGIEKYVHVQEYEDGQKDTFEYTVDKETMDRLEDIVLKTVLKNDLEKNPENIEKVKQAFVDKYMAENWIKFYSASLRQLRSDMIKKQIQETENPTEFGNKVRTDGKKTPEEIAASQERAFGLI